MARRAKPVKRKVTVKRSKRVKLESKPKIRRRLARLWLLRVRAIWENKCAITKVPGEENKLDCHHIENRSTCARLRYDPLNGILLCPSYHKWGKNSAHKGCIWFASWLRKHHRPIWKYVLRHRNEKLDLNDREVLRTLEEQLTTPISDSERSMVRRDT